MFVCVYHFCSCRSMNIERLEHFFSWIQEFSTFFFRFAHKIHKTYKLLSNDPSNPNKRSAIWSDLATNYPFKSGKSSVLIVTNLCSMPQIIDNLPGKCENIYLFRFIFCHLRQMLLRSNNGRNAYNANLFGFHFLSLDRATGDDAEQSTMAIQEQQAFLHAKQ